MSHLTLIILKFWETKLFFKNIDTNKNRQNLSEFGQVLPPQSAFENFNWNKAFFTQETKWQNFRNERVNRCKQGQ